MQAIAYTKCLPINNTEALNDVVLAKPTASGHDLLVKIKAIAVNPVDCKIRQRIPATEGEVKVIGWDAVGEVVAMGEQAHLFNLGDDVFYAGDLHRQGCNGEYQLVDERLVGKKPTTLSHAEAAALPLTTITAWELLFEHLCLKQQEATSAHTSKEVVLVVGAAGGVGSVLIQIAKAITGATIIASASRPTSKAWVQSLGADYVIDHSQPMAAQIADLTIGAVTHIASLTGTETYFEDYIELLSPFGKIAMIDDLTEPLNVMLLKPKSLSFHIEFMFARAMFKAADMHEQGCLLNRMAELVDQGHIKTTLGKHLGTINAENLKLAHAELESRTSIGKIVLEGF